MSESKPPNKYMSINNMVYADDICLKFLSALFRFNIIDNRTRVEAGYHISNTLQKDLLKKFPNKESK